MNILKFTKKIAIKPLTLALILMIIAGIIGPQAAFAIPQMGHGFYGSVTTLEGSPVPYDPANPDDPAHTTMVYAKDVTRVLNFDGEDFSSGEYYGRPVRVDEVGNTRFGYTPRAFIFPAYDPQDPAVQGARPGDQIEFYICAPGMDLPGVRVTDASGTPIRQTFVIGGTTRLNISADIVPPAPETVSPANEAVDVLKDAPVTILFDEDISLVELAAFHIEGSTSGDLRDGDPTLGEDGRTVTLPHLDFDDFGETVTVTIDAGAVSDGVGNLNEVYSWSFETYPYFFTISGNAGVAEAVLHYSVGPEEPLEVIADGDGNYVITVPNGWSGTVTPSKEGYLFTPASRTYTEVSADQPNQDYTAALMTFTISGNAGVAGAELRDGAGVLLATADAAGDYSFTVDYGWSGTVTPSKEGYVFVPTSRTYAPVTEDLTDQDYTATLMTFTISGNAGMEGVELKDGDDVVLATADAAGDYSFTVDYGWSGVVTPVLEGYLFIPASRSYDNVTEDKINQNYTATLMTFTISGNAGVAGAVLHYSVVPEEPLEVIADEDGNYVITVPNGWSGTVTPELEGYEFDPAFREYTNVTADLIEQDYTATKVLFYIYLPLIIND